MTEERDSAAAEAVGTITLVSSLDTKVLTDNLTELRNSHHPSIMSSMHIRLDGLNCLEVIAVKGKTQDIRVIADRMIRTKGVNQGKLTVRTTGKNLK